MTTGAKKRLSLRIMASWVMTFSVAAMAAEANNNAPTKIIQNLPFILSSRFFRRVPPHFHLRNWIV
jgi:hypothetical protein